LTKTQFQLNTVQEKKISRSGQPQVACQGWDKGTGKCGKPSVSPMTYTVKGTKISYSWWFCRNHYNRQMRKRFGTCSYSEWIDGKRVNCTSLRDSNTRGKGRKKRGYCRKHESMYLADAGVEAVASVLDRVARIVTVDTETGCWIAPARDGNGRSHVSLGGRKWLTYRLTYTAFFGGHSKGKELAHDCGRSLCCNPLHLTPLRHKLNVAAEHDVDTAVFWAMSSTITVPPPELRSWADSHRLPLRGTETMRFAESFFPSEEELMAQYREDLEDITVLAS
jgi:hypothetical protein